MAGLGHRLSLWRGWMSVILWLLPAATTQAAELLQDHSFTVQVDRSVRNRIGIYAQGSQVLIHLHNPSNEKFQLIDAATGRAWAGDPAMLPTMRQVYDYSPASEPRDSYLLKLGCGAWSICTSLEGVDFVVMARQGPARNLIEFRFIDFSRVFASLGKALTGQPDAAPPPMTPQLQAALEESAAGDWRPKLRDALRSVRSRQQLAAVQQSGWLRWLESTSVLRVKDSAGQDLQREWELASCRAEVMDLKPAVLRGDVGSARMLSRVVQEQCTAYDFFTHVIDWLMEGHADDRLRLSRSLLAASKPERDETLMTLGQFLGGIDVALARQARNAPSQDSDVSPPSSPEGRPKPGTPRTGSPRPGLEASVGTAPSRAEPGGTKPDIVAVDEKLLELARINATPNQVTLLSFNEQGGLTQADSAALSGTVFRASVVGNEIKSGVFKIEALHRRQAPVRMVAGKYRIPIRIKLMVGQLDRCLSRLHCLTRATEVRTAKQLDEYVEFFLTPDNQFRHARIVKFGPLIPPDLDDSDILRRELTDVRLVIELSGRIAPN